MSKFFIKVIIGIFSYGILLLLGYATFTGAKSLIGVSAAAYWVIMFAGLFASAIILIVSYGASGIEGKDARQKAIESISDATKKKGIFFRVLRWVEDAAIASLLSFSGWVFAAVCYSLVVLLMRLCVAIARDKVEGLSVKPDI